MCAFLLQVLLEDFVFEVLLFLHPVFVLFRFYQLEILEDLLQYQMRWNWLLEQVEEVEILVLRNFGIWKTLVVERSPAYCLCFCPFYTKVALEMRVDMVVWNSLLMIQNGWQWKHRMEKRHLHEKALSLSRL